MLLLHRHMAAADVTDGITAALTVGTARADVVAVEARRLGQDRQDRPLGEPATAGLAPPRVVSLTERRLADPAAVIAGLPADTLPLPSVTGYDELLARRAPPSPGGTTATSTTATSRTGSASTTSKGAVS